MVMIEYNLKNIAKIVGGQLVGESGSVIQTLSIDSRTVNPSPHTLFVALRGERHDGHRFVPELAGQGICSFLVEEIPDGLENAAGQNFIKVKNSLDALQKLGAHRRKQFGGQIITVTGSNGKTITKEWLFQVLASDYKTVRNPKSYNSQVGVPLSLWLLEDSAKFGVFEAGISMPGEMCRLEEMIVPDMGIITNIGEAHQENFVSRSLKIQEKLKLFEHASRIIYCMDHKEIHESLMEKFEPERLFGWAVVNDAALNFEILPSNSKQTNIRLIYRDLVQDVTLPFRDNASIENAMHVMAACICLGTGPDHIARRIAALTPVAMRLEILKGTGGCTLINDSYNSDLNSLIIALDQLNQQNQHSRKSLILSDILQSGMEGQRLYSRVAEMVSSKRIHRFIGIGPFVSKFRDLFSPESLFYSTTEDFISDLPQISFRNEAVLIKGARIFEFEKITAQLQQQVHSTVLEINLNALIHNLNVFREKLGADIRIMVMVKAFSYGSGSVEIANALQFQRADYLCVAYTDEGILLRESGIKTPVVVMNPNPGSFSQMIDFNLEPEIYSFGSLDKFILELRRKGGVSYPVHLKMDTGMHRLGFMREEVEGLIEVLIDSSEVRIASIFSHLAAADDKSKDPLTRKQIRLFEDISSRVQSAFQYPIPRHILNSAGIQRFPEASFEMVRLGIGLYGIGVDGQSDLEPVSCLKSVISQVKNVKKGESIGYGGNEIAPHDMIIAVIPLGYADGIPRNFGTLGGVLWMKGRQAPVLGVLCMDMCIIDVTDLDAREGDEIIVFDSEHPVSLVAEKLGTIPYEILSGISQRVKRIYYQE